MSSSRRSLLAALWSIVGLLTLTSFVIAIVFAYANHKYDNEYAEYNNDWSADNKQNKYQFQRILIPDSFYKKIICFAPWGSQRGLARRNARSD